MITDYGKINIYREDRDNGQLNMFLGPSQNLCERRLGRFMCKNNQKNKYKKQNSKYIKEYVFYSHKRSPPIGSELAANRYDLLISDITILYKIMQHGMGKM